MAVGSGGLGYCIHGIAYKIEHDLLQLDSVSENAGERLGDVEFYTGIVGRGLGPCEDKRIVQHRVDAERAEMRLATAQEFAHAAHHVAGVIDLAHECRQIGVRPFQVGCRRAQQLLCRARERSCGAYMSAIIEWDCGEDPASPIPTPMRAINNCA